MANRRAEELAYWYFRLNGFLLATNVILHPERGKGSARTDADLIGVRFPHHVESGEGWGFDDDVRWEGHQTNVVFVEVKAKGSCTFNQSWLSRAPDNPVAMVRYVGSLPPDDAPAIAEALRADGRCDADNWSFRLVALAAARTDSGIPAGAVQLTCEEVAAFIISRFFENDRRKRNHPQWDEDGQRLWIAVQDADFKAERLLASYGLGGPAGVPEH